MAKRFFRKFTPNQEHVLQSRVLRILGKTLLNRRLWHLNRHSTAWGVACGLFWAWIALPIQSLAAAIMAIAGRGNIALAMAFTWISNPLTWTPCYALAYVLGRKLTGAPPLPNFMEDVRAARDAGPIEGFGILMEMIIRDLPQLIPLYVGGAVLGAFSALVGYATVKLGWRWSIVRRWRRRHETRRRLNPRPRLTSGFAHLARRARGKLPGHS